ncbi:histone-lysine N-methyltransferase EZH2 [Fistulifera solaris]|uniref:Histone-lysine N-methyltransferase EZH2 n=1 Tax=Fistulifera solaris TaxID=1519565 RepID=A0A1Z5K411_FISSO|nr:histone-lysine N-methyltransferase EZH2 [Fistulifera solaris]|eukprot:GAX20987.1 histone-lysine N-methyltransferase EZH2 [Fistulifera solaris]
MPTSACSRADIEKEVRSVFQNIKEKRRHQKSADLEQKLKWNEIESNNYAHLSDDRPKHIIRRTPVPSHGHPPKHFATLYYEGEPSRVTAATPTRVPLAEPLPKSILHAPISRYNCSSMIEDPIFIPYLGDDNVDHTSILSEQELEIRIKATEEGPPMLRDEMNFIVDQALLECSIIKGTIVWEHDETTEYVLSALAQCACLKRARIQERYEVTILPFHPSTSNNNSRIATNTEYDSNITNPLQMTMCGECVNEAPVVKDQLDADYLQDMDSFRALFCRRCLTYCCSIHGLESKPSLELQQNLYQEMDASNCFPSLGIELTDTDIRFDQVKELSTFQKTMCKRAFLMCNGEYKRISLLLGAPEHLIRLFVREHNLQLPPKRDKAAVKLRANTIKYYSVKNYNQKWYNATKDAEIHPFFTPCCHEEMCSEETCSCIQNRFFCTPACCWGAASPNFFRGCGSPSAVSGWGCFTKYALKKGEFIHEYVGELITQEVAEKRGQFDDAKNRSYLFNLTSDYVLDACRMGNKTRFINHSDKPNVETRNVFVNGDQHVAMFALEHIDAEEELFVDYRYNVSMSNDLIEIAKFEPEWLSNGRQVQSSKKPKHGKRKRGKR